jgi:hypothetical protein
VWALEVLENKREKSRLGNEHKNRANHNDDNRTLFNGELVHQIKFTQRLKVIPNNPRDYTESTKITYFKLHTNL